MRNMSERENNIWENYRRHQKSMGILSNVYEYKFWMILISADMLYPYML